MTRRDDREDGLTRDQCHPIELHPTAPHPLREAVELAEHMRSWAAGVGLTVESADADPLGGVSLWLSGTAYGRLILVRILDGRPSTATMSTAGDSRAVTYALQDDDGRMEAYLTEDVTAEPAN